MRTFLQPTAKRDPAEGHRFGPRFESGHLGFSWDARICAGQPHPWAVTEAETTWESNRPTSTIPWLFLRQNPTFPVRWKYVSPKLRYHGPGGLAARNIARLALTAGLPALGPRRSQRSVQILGWARTR